MAECHAIPLQCVLILHVQPRHQLGPQLSGKNRLNRFAAAFSYTSSPFISTIVNFPLLFLSFFLHRHLVALRDIPPGKSILTESPLAFAPPASYPSDDDICIVCLAALPNPNVCGRCFWPVCSSECGRSERHRMECSTLSACARQSEEELLPLRHLLVLRCLLLRHRKERDWEQLMKLEVKFFSYMIQWRLPNYPNIGFVRIAFNCTKSKI